MPAHITNGSLVIEFGFGDLLIAGAGQEGKPSDELVFWLSKPGCTVGDVHTEHIGKSTDEVGALLRFVFHTTASLDVLIHQARQLRDLMGGETWTAEEHDKKQAKATSIEFKE